MRRFISCSILLLILIIVFIVADTMTGAGGFRRMVTITGVYAVCRPDGYDVVCFLDADSHQGGLSCMSLATAGGECKK